MTVLHELRIEPAQSWRRVQELKHWFVEDLEQMQRDNHQRFLESLMLYERQRFLQAHPYQRSEARTDQANGFYSRSLVTALGILPALQVPRARSGRFQTRVLARYARRTAGVDHAIRQVFLTGVSTRQTGRALASLVEEAVSASTVSQVSKVLDASVVAWHRRELADTVVYLILDAVSVRIRLVGAVKRRVALCAYGIDRWGRRQLIGFLIAKNESEETWRDFLRDLWHRGLRGRWLQLITTDGNPGLVAAVRSVWPAVAHQRCWVHKLRNVENRLKRSQQQCLEELKGVYQPATAREALALFRAWKCRWQASAPRAVACVEEDLEELLAFYRCPSEHRKAVRTTNAIERLFVEVRRRIRTMCAFTTRDSCERILYSVFHRMNQYWSQHPLKPFTHNS